MDLIFAPNKNNVNATEIVVIQILKRKNRTTGEFTAGERFRYKYRLTENGWAIDSRDKVAYALSAMRQNGSSPDPYKAAVFNDHPEGNLVSSNESWYFESYAVVTKGPDAGKVISGISWGFDADEDGNLKSHPVKLIPTPTKDFYDSVDSYNKQCKLPNDQQTKFPQEPLKPPVPIKPPKQ